MKLVALFFTALVLISCGTKQKEAVTSKSEKGNIIAKTIGVGRLRVSLNRDIPLYRTAEDTVPFDTLLFSRHKSGEQKGAFMVSRTSANAVNPMDFYKGDSEHEAKDNISCGLVYFAPTLVFRMASLTNNGFEVVLDEDTFESAVIKQDEYHALYTTGEAYWQMDHNSGSSDCFWFLRELWEDYFKRVMFVSVDAPQIYDAPSGLLLYSSKHSGDFSIVALDGEWAKVTKLHIYGEDNKAFFPEEGWIKWTDGTTLLVDPIEEMYE